MADPGQPRKGAPDPRRSLRDELWGMGVADDIAEAWIARWEAEAARRGLDPGDERYWPHAAAWIDERRRAD